MITYGKTVKKIRITKGLPQKLIYPGIVSRSFYSGFENGKYSIEISKFMQILDRLALSYEEFTYIQNGYYLSTGRRLQEKIEKAYSQFNSLELMRIYNEYKSSNSEDERSLAIFAYSLVYLTNKNHLSMSKLPTKEIRDYLKSLDIWTLRDIEKYSRVSITLGREEKLLFFEKAVVSLSYYENYHSGTYERLYSEVYSNYIQELLLVGDENEAKDCYQNMRQDLNEKGSADFEIILRCCEILIGLHTDYEIWEQEARKLLEVIDYIEYRSTNLLRSLIKTHLILTKV